LADAVLLHQDFVASFPAGFRVAVAAGAGRTTWNNKHLAVVEPEAEEVTYLTSDDVAALSPAWSPDGTHLAYSAMAEEKDLVGGEMAREAMMGRRLWVVGADGGPEQLTDDSDYRDERPLWSADGSHILFARFDAQDRASLWLMPLEAGEPQQVVAELTPAPEWFGNYGHIAWHQCFDWWRGEARPTTAAVASSTPESKPTATSMAVSGEDAFSASRAALADYEPVQNAASVVDTLSQECALWLSQGGDPAALGDALHSLPKLASAEVEVSTIDLDDDGLSDVVIEPQFFGLSVLACLGQGEERYTCQPLPDPSAFGERVYTTWSDVLASDLIGDGRPETVITYTVQGGSGWTELLYVFRWPEPGSPDWAFHAALVNWAGPSTWESEPDPTSPGRQQIVLTYPRLYEHGFDHKMLNHPLSRQVWRWDGDAGCFVLSEKDVDMSQSGWGPDMEITTEDRLRWLTNEAETAFRMGQYEEALNLYEQARTFATAKDWTPTEETPDWVGLLRFRRAQTMIYLTHKGEYLRTLGYSADEAVSEMEDVASDYEGGPLGQLAEAFLSGYGEGSGVNAAMGAYVAMQDMEERLRDHVQEERPGALLRFPVTVEGVLCCEPGTTVEPVSDADESPWPQVGVFEADPQ
jgi:hypothetical protein